MAAENKFLVHLNFSTLAVLISAHLFHNSSETIAGTPPGIIIYSFFNTCPIRRYKVTEMQSQIIKNFTFIYIIYISKLIIFWEKLSMRKWCSLRKNKYHWVMYKMIVKKTDSNKEFNSGERKNMI